MDITHTNPPRTGNPFEDLTDMCPDCEHDTAYCTCADEPVFIEDGFVTVGAPRGERVC